MQTIAIHTNKLPRGYTRLNLLFNTMSNHWTAVLGCVATDAIAWVLSPTPVTVEAISSGALPKLSITSMG